MPLPKPGSPVVQGVGLGAVSGTSRVRAARIQEVQHTRTSLKVSDDAGGARGGSTQAAGETRVGSGTDRWEAETLCL